MLVTPTAGTTYTIDEVQADPISLNTNLGYYTNFMNLLDLAAIAVPAGFQADGLPFGITLAAPAFTDGRCARSATRCTRAARAARSARPDAALPARRSPRRGAPDREPDRAARGVRRAHVRAAAQPPAHRARRAPGARGAAPRRAIGCSR